MVLQFGRLPARRGCDPPRRAASNGLIDLRRLYIEPDTTPMPPQPPTVHPARRPRREISPWAIILGSGLLIVAGLVVITLTRRPAPPTRGPAYFPTATPAVSPAPLRTEFTLPGLEGDVALADFRGQYVLVNFWATWCPPCRAEMPALNDYHRANRDRGFSVGAVNVGEDPATVEAFVRTYRVDFPVALDASSAVFAQYRRSTLPSSFLIGPDGTLVKAWPPGALTRAMLERDVTPLLAG